MSNLAIAKLLRSVAAAYTIKNERKFRFQILAYQKAADSIENTSAEIVDLAKENALDTIPGIGTSIKEHLEELLKTGKSKHFEWVTQGIPRSVFVLLDIPSFGPKKAYKLVESLNLKNEKTIIDDLEIAARKGKIEGLESFGKKSQEDIIRAVAEFRQGKGKTTRMVLPIAGETADRIISYLKKSPSVVEAVTLGSLRRMKETIGDVDIAVSSKNPTLVIKHFISYPYKERVIEKGSITASILINGGKQIDLMVLPPNSFGSLLQHFTGSKEHNVHLREIAIKKGYSLSEKGIKVKSKTKTELRKFKTEEEFYKFLGMDWMPPEIREDTGEIELASAHKLPKLVEIGDIKGDLHIHSSFPIEPSHDMGQNTMEDMLDKAKKLGYEYLGFSEHNPSVSKHSKEEIYSILSRRKRKIEQLNESNKYIRVINLLEVDILANGDVAIDSNCASLLDVYFVSIHSTFNMSKNDMTKRILGGLSHPKAKILSHPTGRLLNQRAGYQVDFDKIFDFCKKNNKALEINAWPQRLDLPDSEVRHAIKYGVKMVIDTDSHASWQMDNMRYGVAVARRGWAKKDDILNALPYNKLLAWLEK